MRRLLVILLAVLVISAGVLVGVAAAVGNNGGAPSKYKPPATLTADTLTDSKIFLQWTAPPSVKGVLHYRIYRNDVVVLTTETINVFSYTDRDLTPETEYGYQVTSVGKGDRESDRFPGIALKRKTEKAVVQTVNCTGEGVVKKDDGTCGVDPVLVAAQVTKAMGWTPDQVAIGKNANLDTTPDVRGSAAFAKRTLKTPQAISDLFRENSTEGNAAKARVQDALKSYPGEVDRAMKGGGYIPIQFKEGAIWYGTTYISGNTVIDMRDPRSVPAHDVLWLYITADGVPVPGASIRADCGNPNFIKVIPAANQPPAPSIEVGPCGTPGQPACSVPTTVRTPTCQEQKNCATTTTVRTPTCQEQHNCPTTTVHVPTCQEQHNCPTTTVHVPTCQEQGNCPPPPPPPPPPTCGERYHMENGSCVKDAGTPDGSPARITAPSTQTPTVNYVPAPVDTSTGVSTAVHPVDNGSATPSGATLTPASPGGTQGGITLPVTATTPTGQSSVAPPAGQPDPVVGATKANPCVDPNAPGC